MTCSCTTEHPNVKKWHRRGISLFSWNVSFCISLTECVTLPIVYCLVTIEWLEWLEGSSLFFNAHFFPQNSDQLQLSLWITFPQGIWFLEISDFNHKKYKQWLEASVSLFLWLTLTSVGHCFEIILLTFICNLSEWIFMWIYELISKSEDSDWRLKTTNVSNSINQYKH